MAAMRGISEQGLPLILASPSLKRAASAKGMLWEHGSSTVVRGSLDIWDLGFLLISWSSGNRNSRMGLCSILTSKNLIRTWACKDTEQWQRSACYMWWSIYFEINIIEPIKQWGRNTTNVRSVGLEKYNKPYHRRLLKSSGTGKKASMAQDSVAWGRIASGSKAVVAAFVKEKSHHRPLLLCTQHEIGSKDLAFGCSIGVLSVVR